jgi:hypothetical protein
VEGASDAAASGEEQSPKSSKMGDEIYMYFKLKI